jgi:hypothetical protein
MSKKLSVNLIKSKKELFFSVVTIILTFLSLNMLAGNFGLFEPLFMRFSAVCLLLAIVLINLFLKELYKKISKELLKKAGKKVFVGLILIVVSFVTLLVTETRVFWLISVSILLSGLDLISCACNIRRRELGLLSLMSFFYALFIVFVDNVPLLWYSIQRLSILFSQGLGYLVGKPLVLGPSVSGLWVLLLFLIFYIVLFFVSERDKKKLGLALIGLVVSWVTYLLIRAFYSFDSTADAINSQYIFFLFGLVPTLLYVFKIKSLDLHVHLPSFKVIKTRKLFKKAGVWMLILLFVSGIILTTFFNADSDKCKIVINRKGLMGGWTKPEYGVYGRYASGMFGSLPKYLNEFGYSVEVLDENVSESTFDGVSVFVVINLDDSFTPAEHRLIWDFVERGGSLLVLGDHTDIGGMMKPLNDLLSPVGISFRFDSALPLNHEEQPQWMSCMQLLHHPVNEGIPNENWISISVGASLDVSKTAFPILIGRYAFSDIGNYSNSGGFLGDYKCNPGEQLGDVILVAGAYYGDGKVLVFGDTSSFQNSAMSHSYQMAYNVFKWLNSQKTSVVKYVQVALSLIFLVGVVLIYKFFKEKNVFSVFLPLVLCVALLISSAINPVLIGEKTIQGSVMYIDASHGERFNLDAYTNDATSGLTVNLGRNNYSSFILPVFSEEWISKAEGLILIAPTESFDSGEVAFMKEYMYNGGLVVLSSGHQDKEASEGLLSELSLDIQNLPLGPVPYSEEDTTAPRFVDSWPIIAHEDNNTSVFYSISVENVSYNLVVFKRYGEGGLLVIGDSQFLLDKNLESLYDYWPGNVQFLKNIIDELQDMGVL